MSMMSVSNPLSGTEVSATSRDSNAAHNHHSQGQDFLSMLSEALPPESQPAQSVSQHAVSAQNADKTAVSPHQLPFSQMPSAKVSSPETAAQSRLSDRPAATVSDTASISQRHLLQLLSLQQTGKDNDLKDLSQMANSELPPLLNQLVQALARNQDGQSALSDSATSAGRPVSHGVKEEQDGELNDDISALFAMWSQGLPPQVSAQLSAQLSTLENGTLPASLSQQLNHLLTHPAQAQQVNPLLAQHQTGLSGETLNTMADGVSTQGHTAAAALQLNNSLPADMIAALAGQKTAGDTTSQAKRALHRDVAAVNKVSVKTADMSLNPQQTWLASAMGRQFSDVQDARRGLASNAEGLLVQNLPVSDLARAGQNTTAIAQGASHQPLIQASLGSAQWQQAISQHITLFTRNGQHSAELRLHPAELGSVKISLKLEDNLAQLQLISPHSHVRAALEAALPILRSQLAENGIHLQHSHVAGEDLAGQQFGQHLAQQSHQQSFHQSSSHQQGVHSSAATQSATDVSLNTEEMSAAAASLLARVQGENAVDTFV